jgi:hypothetical protein
VPAKTRRASDGPQLRNQAARVVQGHPWLSLGTLASLAAVVPVVIAGLAWAFGFIETTAHAQGREDKLRSEMVAHVATIYAEVNKNKREFDDFKASYTRESAGVFLQLLENKVYVARNRVNDCEIMRGKQQMSTLERAACSQYDAEYVEAKRRFENQQTAASQTWRAR